MRCVAAAAAAIGGSPGAALMVKGEHHPLLNWGEGAGAVDMSSGS